MRLDDLNQIDRVCLVGHPFSPTGRGEDVRCVRRSFSALDCAPRMLDVYEFDARSDPAFVKELDGVLVKELGGLVNVFHLNGDEIDKALRHLGGLPEGAINVVYPAWELPEYPTEWARELDRFDEVWAPSRFTQRSLGSIVSAPVVHMPLPCEVRVRRFFGRERFGIPHAAFAILFFFDFTSFVARKNPMAVLEAFDRARRLARNENLHLVLKLNRGHLAPEEYEDFNRAIERMPTDEVTILDERYTDDEIKSLVRCCDAFLSLHRSEGFGRGLAEAMMLGKPVIATAWSGNLDFMNSDVARLVDYELIPVKDGEYPHHEGQMWAEPDVAQAATLIAEIADSPRLASELGSRASRHIRVFFSYRASGIRYVSRILKLIEERRAPAPSTERADRSRAGSAH